MSYASMSQGNCFICQNRVFNAELYAREEALFRKNGTTFRRTFTGRIAHIVCLEGKQYDDDQLTLDDYIGKEERT